jgi:hypothetical protein
VHWQILFWPFRSTPLMAVGTYTIVAWAFTAWAAMDFWVAVMVITLALPVWYAVFGFLSLYGEKILVQAATGLFDETIDSETDLNPFQRGVAFRMFVCHLAVFAILFNTGPDLSAILLIPAAIFPLIWLSVVMDESLFRGFHPRQMVTLLKGLNIFYVLVVVLFSGSVGFMHYTLLYASSLPNILASAILFLEANVLFGALLYWRRRSLNLYTHKSPEQERAVELEEEARAMDQLFHELHTHSANGSFSTAVVKIEAFMGEETEALDPLMHERLRDFQDQRLYLEHAVRYLGRLVKRGEVRKGWVLMKECLDLDDRFRPHSDEVLLTLTRSAGREDAGIVNDVLRDFARSYPNSPLIPDALFRRARICIELLGDGPTGVKLLKSIQTDYSDFAVTEEMVRYRKRLKTA